MILVFCIHVTLEGQDLDLRPSGYEIEPARVAAVTA